ncbi:HNWD1 protein [Mycoavidus cysteinexigens]|uniref:HNWD1 protein n=1 Tax=Mycoavidus cysteinexigens TaxID=1553431 RepID=A0A2Z6ES97_9BURK|nr:pentapeptide repeat-containing protein [Mycoavidus cysteinexigens]BBE08287.1 HNWD1 protein [Mycoavidus cysteinexigens]GAM53009.1 hypothetical protein EBME_1472 [bacterium endosymbiont of Mortierella elongata FMR23-6]GLR00792.1 hypothetical protein GCM10007934_06040 [Mycoavidus cysteinexigens]
MWGKIDAAAALQRGEVFRKSAHEHLKTAREHGDSKDKEFDCALSQFNRAKSEFKKAASPDQAINTAITTVYVERGDLYQERGQLYMREDIVCAHNLFKRALASYKKATIEPYNSRADEVNQKIARLKLPDTPAPWQSILKVEEAQGSIKPRFSSTFQPIANFFKLNQNLTLPALGKIYDPVTDLDQLVDTRHLAWCLQQGYLSEAQEKQFKQLARSILEAFARTETQDYFELVREIVPLASIADIELYQQLMSQTVNALSANQSVSLNVSVAQGLAVILRHCPQALLSQVRSGDLVGALEVLGARLDKVHKEDNKVQCQTLLQTTSQLLDVMTCLGVKGINREEVQAPLYATFYGLIDHSEPALAWQARYARQALAHIPNDEAVWRSVLRYTFNVGMGVLNLAAAVKNLDVDKLEESLGRFEEAFIGVREVALAIGQVGDAAKVTVEALTTAYQSASEGVEQFNRPHGWYGALRFIDLLLEENQWVAFEKLARDSRYRKDEKFLQGLCHRLEQIARTHPGTEMQEGAEQFLESLMQHKDHWGGHERVVKMAEATLQRLKQPLPKGGQDYVPVWSSLWQEPPKTQLLDEVREAIRLKQVPVQLEGISLMLETLPELRQQMQDILERQMQQTQSMLEQQMEQMSYILEMQQAQRPIPELAPLVTLPTDLKEQKDAYLKSLEEIGEIKGALATYRAMQVQATAGGNRYFGLDDVATTLFASNDKVQQISQQLEEMKYKIPMLFELEQRQRTQLPSEKRGKVLMQRAEGLANIIIEGSHNIRTVHYSPTRWDAQLLAASLQPALDPATVLYPGSLAKGRRFVFQPASGVASSAISGNNNKSITTYGSRTETGNDMTLSLFNLTDIDKNVQKLLSETDSSTLPSLSQHLIKDPELLQPLAKQAQLNSDFKDFLLALVKRSKMDDHFQITAANALTTLVKAKVPLTGEDFSGIRVPGADLSYGIFDHTQFENADLSQANFQGAWLRGANFEGATLAGVEFGEMPALALKAEASVCRYSPNGLWLAVATNTGMKLYRQATTLEPYILKGDTGAVHSIAFSPNNKWLACGKHDGTIQLWSIDKDTPALQHTLKEHEHNVLSIAFSQKGNLLASSDNETIKLWDLNDMPIFVHTLKGHTDRVLSIAFSTDDEWLASGSNDSIVKLWNVKKGTLEHSLEGHTSWVNSVAFSPDKNWLASASADKTIKLWKLGADPKPQHTLEAHNYSVKDIAFSQNSELLASASIDKTVKLWVVKSGALQHIFEGHSDSVEGVAFSPDGKWIASSSTDKTVRLRKVKQTPPPVLEGHTDCIKSLAFSPNGKWFASSGADKTVNLWDAQTHTLSRTFRGQETVGFSPDNELALANHERIKLWSIETLLFKRSSTLKTLIDSTICSIAFSPDSKWLTVAGEDETLELWSLEANTAKLKGYIDSVYAAFSPDNTQLASVNEDGTIHLYSLANKPEIQHTLKGHSDQIYSIAFSPTGRWLASASYDETIKLWDVKTNISTSEPETLKGHTNSVYSMAFSPNGEWLVSGSADMTVRLWSIASKKCLAVIRGFYGSVSSIVWQKEDCFLTGGEDKTIRLWKVVKPDSENADFQVILCWASHQTVLSAVDISVKKAKGLSEVNTRLLMQKAIKEKEQQNDAASFRKVSRQDYA